MYLYIGQEKAIFSKDIIGIFDLDNTLYPSSAQMDKGITTRMMNCVAEFFNTSYEEAVKIRAEHITNFSTTLEWLRSEGLTDIETYFSKVHPQLLLQPPSYKQVSFPVV